VQPEGPDPLMHPEAAGGGYTAMQKLRIVMLGFGTARQKRVLE
jgi:hypothetical protein